MRDALSKLRSTLGGVAIAPHDPGYDTARRVASLNPATDKRPAVIVQCATTADVVRSVEFARTQGLEVAVRGGGHDVLGRSVCERGVVIDLSPMKRIDIDRERRLVRADAGLRSRELIKATQRYGLAPALGCNAEVGISGLTLGGGLGWFSGRYGAACDNLVAAEVVTADARTLRASVSQNPELFWALRGGGGNFGIVTELDYRLHHVGPVLGGLLAYRGAQLAEFLHFYRTFMANAPDELTVEVTVLVLNEPAVLAAVCYSGEPEMGARVVAPLLAFGPPLADSLRILPPTELTEDPSLRFLWQVFGFGGVAMIARRWARRRPSYSLWKGGSIRELGDPSIEVMVRCAADAPAGGSLGLGHYMHGALCNVADAETPLSRPWGALTYFASAEWLDASHPSSAVAWVERSWNAMQRTSGKGAYVNYLSVDDADAVRESYGASYLRLVEAKKRFDPTNFFHLNRNIPPG